jgi:hypothetical protein
VVVVEHPSMPREPSIVEPLVAIVAPLLAVRMSFQSDDRIRVLWCV